MRSAQRQFARRVLFPFITFILGCSFTYFAIQLGQRTRCYRRLHPHQSATSDDSNLLLILILSAPQNIDRRDAIRKTWLTLRPGYEDDSALAQTVRLPQYNRNGFVVGESVTEQQHHYEQWLHWLGARRNARPKPATETRIRFKHRFVIGTAGLGRIVTNQIQFEQKENNDLMLLDTLQDSYQNLTQKTLVAYEQAITDFEFKYILKCDDDSYVKLGDLLSELLAYDDKMMAHDWQQAAEPAPELYWGYFNGRAQIKVRGQWQETNFNVCDRYLPYALGGGYVISYGVAAYVAENRQQLAAYVSEDISMGVWLAALRNIYRRHDVRFDTGYLPRACRTHHLVLHKREVIDLRRLRAGDECSFKGATDVSIKRPPAYFYDWTKSSAKCCDTLLT